MHEGTDSSLKSVLSRTLENEGPGGFYSGFRPNLLRILPHYAIVFVLYEYFSDRLS